MKRAQPRLLIGLRFVFNTKTMRQNSKGMGGHHQTEGKNDEWLTPPEIIKSLGAFDLDPCAPIVRPWDTATNHYTINDDGLSQAWFGRVWLNPPYNRYTISAWLSKMANHFNGICLLFARTETEAFHQHIFPFASSMLFMEGRITFYDVDGNLARIKTGKYAGQVANSGAPSVLISYGEQNVDALAESNISGRHVLINSIPVITITQSPDWRSVVSISLVNLNGKGDLKSIYTMVERIAPDKVERNQFYKEKIRQKLQKYYRRVDKGVYSV